MVASGFLRAVSVTVSLAFGIIGTSGQGLRVISGQEHCSVLLGGNCVFEGYGNHGHNESCTVEVLAAGTLSVNYFDIQTCADGSCDCDYLDVAGQRYCGNTTDQGPLGIAVTPGFTFDWVSDHENAGSGWTVCLSNLVVTSGGSSCKVTNDGNCVTTGPDYDNNEACTIDVLEDGALFSNSFDVESSPQCSGDALTIGDTRYCNATGPQGVAVEAGSSFSWESNGTGTSQGWTVCLNSLVVTAGHEHCQLREGGKCVWEGYGDHGDNESCTVEVLAAGKLSVTFMDIQVCGDGSNCTCDYLDVGGQRYCGKTSAGPHDVVSTPGSTMHWYSDNATSEGGFTICLTSDTVALTTTAPTTTTAASSTLSISTTPTSNAATSLNMWLGPLAAVVSVAYVLLA